MPLQNVHFIEADIKEKKIMEEPRVVANDDIAFIVSITDNGNSIDTSLVTQTVLASVRPDRKTVITPGVLLEDGTVKFELGHTETQKSGQVKATAQLFDSEGDRISSVAFSYHVERDPTGEDYIPTEKDKTFIEIVLVEGPEVIQQAKDVTAAAQQATSNADTATGRADTAASGAEAVIEEFAGFKDSAVKGKTFGTVDERFEDLESDSYIPMKNDIINGDFSNGVDGWMLSGYNSDFEVIDGYAKTTNSTSSGKGFIQNNVLQKNKKYYVRFKAKVDDYTKFLKASMLFGIANVDGKFEFPITSNEWTTKSFVEFKNSDSTTFRLLFEFTEVSSIAAYLDDVVIINLTSVFGAGNEPTKEEMDTLLSFYPNSWFGGTVNLANNKKLVSFLMTELRKKADKKQEAWFTPTLLNGWNGGGGGSSGVRVYKDTTDKVLIQGHVQNGTAGVAIFILPPGYRPSSNIYYESIAADVRCQIRIFPDGQVLMHTVPTAPNSWVSLNGIYFRPS